MFQRTPSSVDVRNNRAHRPGVGEVLKPGWQQQRMDNFNILVSGGRQEEDLVNDGWTDIIRNCCWSWMRQDVQAICRPQASRRAVELADFEKMEEIRARVDAIVKDPATAEALKPWYRQFCKRPCFHDEYLRPSTGQRHPGGHPGQGVDAITETGVVCDRVGDTRWTA